MAMKRHWIKWSLGIVAGVAIVAALGVIALRSWERQVLETKSVRELTVSVMRKEHVRFDEKNSSYIDDVNFTWHEKAHRVERRPGDEEWRVYYEIYSFDPTDEPTSSRLLEAEKQRVANGKWRFTILSREKYEQLNVGDKIHLKYQRFSDGEVMIW